MRTHQEIEERSLALAAEIDADPARRGLERARRVCARWAAIEHPPDVDAWQEILKGPWPSVRAALLDPSETGRRLRQSSPFCGILTPRERWSIWRRFRTQ